MSALAREPLTMKDVRRLVYARLPLWGDYLKHGYLPRHASDIGRSSTKPGSRLPAPDWLFDLSCAFAKLNPTTASYAYGAHQGWLAHVQFNDYQRTIWAYYVEAPDAGDIDTRSADATLFAHQREHELQHAIKAHDSKRDAAVARVLHIDSRRVRYLRQSAVWTMSTLVGWERD